MVCMNLKKNLSGKRKNKSDEYEMPIEFDLAYMYNVKRSLGIGFELRNHNEITKEEGWEHSVLFGGPTIYFRSQPMVLS